MISSKVIKILLWWKVCTKEEKFHTDEEEMDDDLSLKEIKGYRIDFPLTYLYDTSLDRWRC